MAKSEGSGKPGTGRIKGPITDDGSRKVLRTSPDPLRLRKTSYKVVNRFNIEDFKYHTVSFRKQFRHYK